MIQAFAGNSTGNRRWMTAPSRALSTIREMDDTDVDEPIVGGREETLGIEEPDTPQSSEAMASLDSEIVLNQPKSSVKQMRIPRSRNRLRASISI